MTFSKGGRDGGVSVCFVKQMGRIGYYAELLRGGSSVFIV